MVKLTALGTHHRNHCPFCLWSKHVDAQRLGDRNDSCQGMMKPAELAFKKEKIDKYGKERQGELVIIHQCLLCGKISRNRIAGDDSTEEITKLVDEKKIDKEEVLTQLFGKENYRRAR